MGNSVRIFIKVDRKAGYGSEVRFFYKAVAVIR